MTADKRLARRRPRPDRRLGRPGRARAAGRARHRLRPGSAGAPAGAGARRVDVAADDPAEAVGGADVALVAAPVQAPAGADRRRRATTSRAAVVTDVGSTKHALVEAVDDRALHRRPPARGRRGRGRRARPRRPLRRRDLVPHAARRQRGHPAGAPAPLRHRPRRAPAGIDADTHDRLMAAFSHVPHVVANALVAQAAARAGRRGDRRSSARRFATRPASPGANPPLWAASTRQPRRGPRRARRDDRPAGRGARRLAAGDGRRWRPGRRAAGAQRRALLDVGMTGGPLCELRVVVPNRPGVIADLALTLSRAGINIHDMSLSPRPDFRSGEVALWVAARPRRARAVAGRGARLPGGPRDVRRFFRPPSACAAPSRRRPTSRSPTAPRSSARWPPSPYGCATTCTPRTPPRR